MRRRTFLQATGAGLATAVARPLWALPPDNRYLKTIGLQMFTLRNQLEKDVAGTFKAVADAGYYQVELMRLVGAEHIIKAARDVGLKISSAFMEWHTLLDPGKEGVPSFQAVLDVAVKNKLQFLGIPYIGKGSRETVDQFKTLAENANRAGEVCRQANIQLFYHHHSFEFKRLRGGQSGWDVLLAEFDPKLVKFEIDAFWTAIGGRDPVQTIKDLKGRVVQLHLKDLLQGTPTIYDELAVPKDAFKELGRGIIDWRSVLAAAEAVGVKQCHVEQDYSPDPFDSIRQSMSYLKAM